MTWNLQLLDGCASQGTFRGQQAKKKKGTTIRTLDTHTADERSRIQYTASWKSTMGPCISFWKWGDGTKSAYVWKTRRVSSQWAWSMVTLHFCCCWSQKLSCLFLLASPTKEKKIAQRQPDGWMIHDDAWWIWIWIWIMMIDAWCMEDITSSKFVSFFGIHRVVSTPHHTCHLARAAPSVEKLQLPEVPKLDRPKSNLDLLLRDAVCIADLWFFRCENRRKPPKNPLESGSKEDLGRRVVFPQKKENITKW